MTFEWPGEKLLVRLLESAEKSCIGLARPWLMKREGTAKAAADYRNKLALGQAESDLEEVKAGRARYDATAGRLVPLVRPLPTVPEFTAPPAPKPQLALPAPSTGTLIPRLGSALDFATHTLLQSTVKEMERTINLERILQTAEIEAESVDDADVADGTPSIDWISRWREGAQDVTDAQLQLLWARVLTGEVQRPGQFSLRTLNFLQFASKEEATLIEAIGPFVTEAGFIWKSAELLNQRSISFGHLLVLQNLGVVSGVGDTLFYKLDESYIPKEFICHDIGIQWDHVVKEITFPVYHVTALGEELTKLNTFKADKEYMRSFAKSVGTLGLRCRFGPVTKRVTTDTHSIEVEESFGPTDVEFKED